MKVDRFTRSRSTQRHVRKYAAHILVLGTADWNQAIATNQHYAVRELARKHQVTFVQSMGLRRIELSTRDLSRIWQRVTATARSHPGTSRRPVPEGVRIISPRVIPRHVGLARRLNSIQLRWQLRSWRRSAAFKVLWLYSPVDYGLSSEADSTIYHCVDLLSTVPGISSELIEVAERTLAESRLVVAAASSPAVLEHLRTIGFHSPLYWPNVADVSVFSAPTIGLRQGRRSEAIFAGNLTESKVDFELLHDVVGAGVTLHLVGPLAEGGGKSRLAVDRLVSAGAQYHGLLPLTELAQLQATCSVGLIPYQSNEYTNGVSPLKTFEYLASGLAVVSTGVPSVQAVDGHVRTTTREDFVPAVKRAMEFGPPTQQAVASRQSLAIRNGWDARGAQMRRLVTELLSRR